MATEYKTHLKKGTLRAMAFNLPMPKTTGAGDTDCNQRGYDQWVTVDPAKVDCTKCLSKLANFKNRTA
jgi:hypothetical protein